MGKTGIIKAAAIAVLFSAMSCSVMDESRIVKEPDRARLTVVNSVKTKSMGQSDSLAVLHAYQSDKRRMLLQSIEEVDGACRLLMTEEDARQLNIPDSLYIWASQVVEALNK